MMRRSVPCSYSRVIKLVTRRRLPSTLSSDRVVRRHQQRPASTCRPAGSRTGPKGFGHARSQAAACLCASGTMVSVPLAISVSRRRLFERPERAMHPEHAPTAFTMHPWACSSTSVIEALIESPPRDPILVRAHTATDALARATLGIAMNE